MYQSLFVRRLGESEPELLPDMLFICSPSRGQDPPALDRGILMIDARGDRQRDLDGFGRYGCSGCRDMKRCPGT